MWHALWPGNTRFEYGPRFSIGTEGESSRLQAVVHAGECPHGHVNRKFVRRDWLAAQLYAELW